LLIAHYQVLPPFDQLFQEARPFVVGLSDDAGAGAQLGFAAKQTHAPDALGLQRLDDYVFWTLYGVKTDTATPPLFSLQDRQTDRILMTLFYFNKTGLNTTNYYTELDKCTLYPSWCAFNAPHAPWDPNWIATYRGYNFPHQIATYYALYRAARNYDKATLRHTWDWYLTRAYKTILALGCLEGNTFRCASNVGFMDGTVMRDVLKDMKAEGWTDQVKLVELQMSMRTIQGVSRGTPGWVDQPYPYGSEFSWDTTGFEEVAVWGSYFNATSTRYGSLEERTVNYILAFMPSIPCWAWHGSAHGWGDFSNNAKWMVTNGWEREGLHYRAGLNSIPLLERYVRYPDDEFILQVGTGAISGLLTNIDDNGAASMGFHTHPFVMDFDPNSGDYGLAFFGHSENVGSYLVSNKELGWLCYLCDVTEQSGSIMVVPRDSYGVRAYFEPLGLLVVSEAGTFAGFNLMMSQNQLDITFKPPSGLFSQFRLCVVDAAGDRRPYHSFTVTSPPSPPMVRGCYALPTSQTRATISWKLLSLNA